MKTVVLRYCRNDAWFFAVIIFSILGILPALGHAQHRQSSRPDTLSARESAAQVLFNQARTAERRNPDKALAIYEQIAQKFGKNDPPFLRLLAVKALFKKAEILLGKDNTKDAILTFERLESRFGQDKELPVREILASALVSKAEPFYKQGNAEKALATYVQLDRKFNQDESDFIRQLVDITKWRSAEIRSGGNMALSSSP